MRKRLSSLGRCTAMLLIAVWALQPVGTLVHAEAHAHRFCAEHQTFEEAARGSGQVQAHLARGGAELSTQPASQPGDTAVPTHEACPLLATGTREGTLAPEAGTVTEACLAASRPATAPPLRARGSLPILATAPKASPPARV